MTFDPGAHTRRVKRHHVVSLISLWTHPSLTRTQGRDIPLRHDTSSGKDVQAANTKETGQLQRREVRAFIYR